jgi:glycosyltransferase involved in cell wall biosynthesis
LLSVGTVEPRKNHQLLLRVYDELVRQQPEFPFDLVIAGGWGWRSRPLQRLYRSLQSRARIHFTGYVSDAEKRALYASAKLFLYPSFYEGFGLPVLEAMAVGVPVLASHTSSLPEVVGEAGVLLTPYNPAAWLSAVRWLVDDKQARAELSAKGRTRAREFSWEQAANSYYALFHELGSQV